MLRAVRMCFAVVCFAHLHMCHDYARAHATSSSLQLRHVRSHCGMCTRAQLLLLGASVYDFSHTYLTSSHSIVSLCYPCCAPNTSTNYKAQLLSISRVQAMAQMAVAQSATDEAESDRRRADAQISAAKEDADKAQALALKAQEEAAKAAVLAAENVRAGADSNMASVSLIC